MKVMLTKQKKRPTPIFYSQLSQKQCHIPLFMIYRLSEKTEELGWEVTLIMCCAGVPSQCLYLIKMLGQGDSGGTQEMREAGDTA